MQKRKFIVSEEPFKLLPLEKAPKAEAGTAIVLYRQTYGVDKGIVILPNQVVLSSSIRMAKYDRKVIVDMTEKTMKLSEKLETQEHYCKFLVDFEVKYAIKDAKSVFNCDMTQIEEEIETSIHKFLLGCQGKFALDEEIALRRKLDELKQELEQVYLFLYIMIQNSVKLDGAGQTVLDSNVKTITDGIVAENEHELRKAGIQQEKELERFRYQEEAKVREEKRNINKMELEDLTKLTQLFGTDGLLINAYLRGELSSTELDKRMKEDRARKIEEFKQFYREGMITEETLDQYINQTILGVELKDAVIETKKSAQIVQKAEVELEDGDEIGSFKDSM